MTAAIETDGVAKAFGETHALDGVDLSIAEGSILGLLGPNGAGKTTLVRILATLIEADAGSASVGGHDVATAPRAVREQIGLTGQFTAVDVDLSGRENLEFVGRLSQLSTREARSRTQELLKRFGLFEAADRRVAEYSGGMVRRLDLAASLIARPRVLFLDEPTTGLDPQSRAELWEAIRALAASGTTILLTTQYLEEADQLADRIAVITRGRLIANGTPAELKNEVGGQILELGFASSADATRAVEALTELGERPAELRDGVQGTRVAVALGDETDRVMQAIRSVDRVGVVPDAIDLQRPSLDDVFFALTGASPKSSTEDDRNTVERLG